MPAPPLPPLPETVRPDSVRPETRPDRPRRTSLRSAELLVDLPDEVIRAVTLGVALQGLGKEWRHSSQSIGSFPWRPHLSRPTHRIQYFLSHDWGTSGWLKYFTLLVFFNSRASAVVTLIVSSVIGILCSLEFLPKSGWWVFLGEIVAIGTLFFWQHVRDLFKLPQMVFLDGLCIPQHDDEQKTKCIYGLASFLDRSDTLLMLWSPRYCTRLWCMYEIGCFLLKQTGVATKNVLILPVQTSVLWFLCYIQVSFVFLTALIGQRVDNVFNWHKVEGGLSLGAVVVIQVFVLYAPYFYIMNRMLHDLEQLPTLFRDFSLEGAQCFCCSSEHLHPVTKEEMPCDRKRIYKVLRHWAGVDATEDIQIIFKDHLDEHVIPSLERTFNNKSIFLWPLITSTRLAACPFICDFTSHEFHALARNIHATDNTWRNAGFPIYIFFMSFCLVHCSLLIGRLGVRCHRWRRCVLLVQVMVFLWVGLIFAMAYMIAVGVGPRKFEFTAIGLLPFFLLCLVMVWSIYIYAVAASWSQTGLKDPEDIIKSEGREGSKEAANAFEAAEIKID